MRPSSQVVPNSVVPPADEKHTAVEDSGSGKEAAESVPVSTSGPVSEDKVQSALSAIPNPKMDDTDEAPEGAGVKEVKDKDVKDSSGVGGAETGPITGEGEKPAPTTDEVTKEKEGEADKESKEESKPEESGEKEKETAKEKEVLATNGPDEEGEPAEDKAEEKAGEKRGAVNGGKEDGPAKKAKTEAPTTNGGAAKGKAKREKKPAAPVGKTARRTRSQGLA